jgi:Uma2 family endonuclease
MSTTTLMTAEQFAQMHTGETEDYELVEGELIPLSSATPLHAKVRRRLERLVENYFERNPIGEAFAEIDCRLTDDTVRRPDLSIFLGDRSKQFDLNSIPVPYAPDIAVEVLSPSESAIDVSRRALDYLAAGCREVWLLDNSNGELSVRTDAGIRLLRGKDVLESPLLPGFSQAVSELHVSSAGEAVSY